MGIRLRTPAGGVVVASEDKATRLLKQGFTRVESAENPPPKKRGRPRKNEGERK